MSVWLAASIALAAGLVPCVLACARADVPSSLAVMNVAVVVAIMLLVTMTVAFDRQPFIDLAVVLVPIAAAGTLAFARFLERRR